MGGWDGSNRLAGVTVYTETGFEKELPPLETGRSSAACGVVGGVRLSQSMLRNSCTVKQYEHTGFRGSQYFHLQTVKLPKSARFYIK